MSHFDPFFDDSPSFDSQFPQFWPTFPKVAQGITAPHGGDEGCGNSESICARGAAGIPSGPKILLKCSCDHERFERTAPVRHSNKIMANWASSKKCSFNSRVLEFPLVQSAKSEVWRHVLCFFYMEPSQVDFLHRNRFGPVIHGTSSFIDFRSLYLGFRKLSKKRTSWPQSSSWSHVVLLSPIYILYIATLDHTL